MFLKQPLKIHIYALIYVESYIIPEILRTIELIIKTWNS